MLTYAKAQWRQGREIYGYHSWREKRRILLYTVRSYKNHRQLQALKAYFDAYKPFPDLLREHVGIYEVINRIFLYKDSTAQERLQCIEDHFNLLPLYFTEKAIRRMYTNQQSSEIVIWQNEELDLKATLWFHTGQRKEGFLSLFLFMGTQGIYHINFRLGYGYDKEPCLWIGTIQGYKEGLANAKKLTKKMFGYRPKNFMFFLLRQLASNMGITSLYAVSDEGFYTNTHLIRGNRSKKVRFNPFWEELGGTVCAEDKRFYRIPVAEERKTYETAKTHKRNMYRKRYEMLDTFIEEIAADSVSYIKR